jgi:hypothetical protein
MIHDESITSSPRTKDKTLRKEKQNNSILQAAVPATASQKRG